MNDRAVNPVPADAPKCPQCGTPQPIGSLAGLCPACLLQQGAAADTVTEGKQPPFNPPPVAELAPLFPQLEILELIGKGGMGAVYKARQKQLDRVVALKILPPGIGDDPAFAERFAREAKALAKLNHPGIVTLYEFGSSGSESAQTDAEAEKEKGRKGAGVKKTTAGDVYPDPFPPFSSAQSHVQPTPEKSARLYYFLMEFVDGVNLRQLLHFGRVSPREALAIVPQICDALQFAHDLGIVHRDIKPENILLDRRGRVKVADFGLAKIVGTDAPLTPAHFPSDGERVAARPGEGISVLTDAGKVMGTPNYMAPEQVSHPADVDHRVDIYALGVVFYQMLTGELPGKRIEPPSKKVQIDVRLDEVVLRALEKNPGLRYQQVSEVKTCVETITASAQAANFPGTNVSRMYRGVDYRSKATLFGLPLVHVASGLDPVTGKPRVAKGIIAIGGMAKGVVAIGGCAFGGLAFGGLAVGVFAFGGGALGLISFGGLAIALVIALGGGAIAPIAIGGGAVGYLAFGGGGIGAHVFDSMTKDPVAEQFFLPWAKVLMTSVQWINAVFLGLALPIGVGVPLWLQRRAATNPSSSRRRESAPSESHCEPEDLRRPASAATIENYRPLALMLVSVLFILLGAYSIWDMAYSTRFFTQKLLPTIFCLPIGIGLLRLRWLWRRYALACVWLGYVLLLLLLGVIFAKANGVQVFSGVSTEIFGVKLAGLQATWVQMIFFLAQVTLLPWLHVVLLRPKVKALFEQQRGKGTDWLETLMVIALVLFAFGWIPMRAHESHKTTGDTPALGQGEAVTTNIPSASLETWSPTVAPSEKPDLQKILGEAKELMEKGRYEEALQRHLWYQNHALEYDQGQGGVRLSFALSDWMELGRRYPKAKQALIEIRDAKTREFADGGGYSALFQDVASINGYLQNNDSTLELFKQIEERDTALAYQCYFAGESLLVERGEYQLCLKCIGDPQVRFDLFRRGWEMQKQAQRNLPTRTLRLLPGAAPPPDMAQMADNNFIKQVRTLIEILVGVGRKTEAEKIRDQAVAVFNVPKLQSAVADAEKTIGERKTASLDETPKLLFLAWQDEWKTNQPGAARDQNGSPVTDAMRLKWLRQVQPGGMDVSSWHLSPEPRFLHLWFSHPLFDQISLNEVTLLDEQNSVLPLGARGSMTARVQAATKQNDGLGWLTKTLSPGEGTNIPHRVTVRLRYTTGPLEKTQDVPISLNRSISMSLEGDSQLNGVGQNVDGKAFVAIAVDAGKMKSSRFGVVAVTKNGREFTPSGGESGNSDGTGVGVANFVFDVPLANVAKFIIGTRPIRRNEWKNVVLPPN